MCWGGGISFQYTPRAKPVNDEDECTASIEKQLSQAVAVAASVTRWESGKGQTVVRTAARRMLCIS